MTELSCPVQSNNIMNQESRGSLKVEPRRIARLFALEEAEVAPWSKRDLADVLRHQLKAPIRLGIVETGPELGEAPAKETVDWSVLNTFEKVLHHPHPPVSLLCMIKEFAKAHLDASGCRLPAQVAAVVYLASIASALVHCHERISQSDNQALERAFVWAIDQGWVDENLKGVLRAGFACLHEGRAPA
jgi:hypothetical protein